MRARTWAGIGALVMLASWVGWLSSRTPSSGASSDPGAGSAVSAPPDRGAAKSGGDGAAARRAAAASRAASELGSAASAGLLGPDAVEVIDAGIDLGVVDDVVAESRWQDAGARSLGQRCQPPPCVIGFSMPDDLAQRNELQDAIYGALMEAGGNVAQPTIAWSDDDDGTRLGFAWFVPNVIDAVTSEAMQAQAAQHVVALGGKPAG